MIYAPFPSTSPGKCFDVIEVTDETITIRHPDDGRTKTVRRPVDYDPEKGQVPVKAPKTKRERVLSSRWSATICIGAWTTCHYDDGTSTARLTEKWDTPLPYEALKTDPQRQAQAEHEASLVKPPHPKTTKR